MVALSEIEWAMDPDVAPFWEKSTRQLYFGARLLRAYRSTPKNDHYPAGTIQATAGDYWGDDYLSYCSADDPFAVHAILAAATFDPPPQE